MVAQSPSFKVRYAVPRELDGFPVWAAKFIGSRPVGEQDVYDISVPGTENFIANGITVHNCVLNAKVNYLDMPGLVRRQREAIQEKLKSVSKNHIVYHGISFDPNNHQEIMKIAGISAYSLPS